MDTSSFNTLLHEAQMVANFATRNGTLPEQSRLFELIDELTLARDRGEHPNVTPLITEMSLVARKSKVTIEQLMRRKTKLGQWRHLTDSATPFLLGFVTLLLTLYLAFQSSELHKADLALREYQELVGERLQEKIYLAWKMYSYEHVLSVKGPVLAQLDGYQKLVDDAKRLYVKRDAVQDMLVDTAVIRYVPPLFQSHGPCMLQNLARTLNSDTTLACAPTLPGVAASGPLPEGPPGEYVNNKKDAVDCAAPYLQPAIPGKALAVDGKVDLERYVQSVSCFVHSLNMVNYDEPVDRTIYKTRNKVHLLVSWLLPGLYGLLGACVFVMRALLNGAGPNKMGGDARIVDMLSLLLRVSLGGLAGIIIGWFSVPTSSAGGSATIVVSSIPFGMAFLAGYGIESLFSLLDRLNKTIGQQPDDSAVARADGPANLPDPYPVQPAAATAPVKAAA